MGFEVAATDGRLCHSPIVRSPRSHGDPIPLLQRAGIVCVRSRQLRRQSGGAKQKQAVHQVGVGIEEVDRVRVSGDLGHRLRPEKRHKEYAHTGLLQRSKHTVLPINLILTVGGQNHLARVAKGVGPVRVGGDHLDDVGGVGEFNGKEELEPAAQRFGGVIDGSDPGLVIPIGSAPSAHVQGEAINSSRLGFAYFPLVTGETLPIGRERNHVMGEDAVRAVRPIGEL